MRPIELIPESIDVTNNGPESLHLPFGVVIAPGATATINLFKYTGGPTAGAGVNAGGTSNDPAKLDPQTPVGTVVGTTDPGPTAGIPIGAGAPRAGYTAGDASSANAGPVHISGDSPRQRLWNAIVASAQDGLVADKFVSTVSAVAARGTAQVPGDVLTAVGGTIDTAAATFTVTHTELATAAVATRGTGYAPSDTLTAAGGTGTGATLTVTDTEVATAAITSGGSGYVALETLTVATGTGTAATIRIDTVDGSGVITGITVLTRGDYTVNPTLINSPTGGSGTLASITLVMGVKTVAIATRGDYTVNPTLANSPTGGGSGVSITLVMGVKTVTILNKGDYVTTPTNPVATTSSGTGLAATLTLSFVSKVLTLANQVVGSGQPNIAVGNSGGYFGADLDYQTPWEKRTQAVDTGVRSVNGTVGFNAAPRGGAAVVGIIPR